MFAFGQLVDLFVNVWTMTVTSREQTDPNEGNIADSRRWRIFNTKFLEL
jgi:hypothetical protein